MISSIWHKLRTKLGLLSRRSSRAANIQIGSSLVTSASFSIQVHGKSLDSKRIKELLTYHPYVVPRSQVSVSVGSGDTVMIEVDIIGGNVDKLRSDLTEMIQQS